MGENSEVETSRSDEARAWMSYAEMDYNTAEHLLNGVFYPLPLEIICYHSQQAAEKAVKAVVVSYGNQGGMPKVHDISFLMTQIHNLVKEEKDIDVSEELMDKADSLTQYGVMPRYPNELEVDERMAKIAVDDAKAIMDWCRQAMKG